MSNNNILSVLENHPLIPVVTFQEMDEIEPIIEKLLEKNINCIEVTLRTSVAMEAIQRIKRTFSSELTIGAGTVTSQNQIVKLKDINVDFVVSPGTTHELLTKLIESELPFITGVSTPSEILLGVQQNCRVFKFFPANLFGGTAALKAYAQIFPDVLFCPTGGISEETYKDYLSLPNVVSVGGSWMLK